MQSKKETEDILELCTEMDVKNALIEWYIHRFHCLGQRKRCAGMIQTTRLVHRPHRPNHRTEANKLHRRREMYHLVWTLFISDSRMTCRKVRKFGILQFAPDDTLDCKVPIVESESGLERPFPIWETMTRKVVPFVPAKLFNDPRSARFLSIYMRECGEAAMR